MVVAITIATVVATVIAMNVVIVQSVTIKLHRVSVHNVTKNHVNQGRNNSNQDLSQRHKMVGLTVHNPQKVSKILNSVSRAKAFTRDASPGSSFTGIRAGSPSAGRCWRTRRN